MLILITITVKNARRCTFLLYTVYTAVNKITVSNSNVTSHELFLRVLKIVHLPLFPPFHLTRTLTRTYFHCAIIHGINRMTIIVKKI